MHWDGKHVDDRADSAAGRRAGRPVVRDRRGRAERRLGDGRLLDDQTYDRSLIMHWNGATWSVVPHNCDTYQGLTGVTVVSATERLGGRRRGDLPLRRHELDRGPEPAASDRVLRDRISARGRLRSLSERCLGRRRARDRRALLALVGCDRGALERRRVDDRLRRAGTGSLRRRSAFREATSGRSARTRTAH